MATKTFLFKDALASSSSAGSLQDGGSITNAATTTTFAVQSTFSLNDYRQIYQSTQSSFSTRGTEPSGAPISSAQDCWRSENTLNGTFAAGTWTLTYSVADDLTLDFDTASMAWRLWRSTNANGTSATQITSGIRTTTACSMGSGSVQTQTGTVSLGSVTLTNEYLFLQVAIGNDAAGTSGFSYNVTLQVGTTRASLATTDFTAGGGGGPTLHLLSSTGVGI